MSTCFDSRSGFNSEVRNISLQSDGKIILGGNFTQYSGIPSNYIARLNTGGTYDNSFQIGAGFNSDVYTTLIQDDGKIIAGGDFGVFGGFLGIRITQLNSGGTQDTSFQTGLGFNDLPKTINYQSDGKMIIGGIFTQYDGIPSNYIVRLNPDGSYDNTFDIGDGFDSWVFTTSIQSDGKIIVGGLFSQYSGVETNKIARLNTDGSRDETFVIGSGFNSLVTTSVVQSDGKIIVGGNFSEYSGISSNYIARLNSDGSYDNSFNIGDGFNSELSTISLQSDGKIIAGGSFNIFSGISSNYIARLNPDGSYDNSFNIGDGFNDTVVTSVIQSDGKILVGGFFNSFSGISSNYIVRLNSDGSYDNTFNIGAGFNTTVKSLIIQSDEKIIAAGDFNTYDGNSISRIVRLNTDGSFDPTFNVNFDQEVSTLTQNALGKLAVGGLFNKINSISAQRIIRLNTDGTKDETFNYGSGFDGNVVSISKQNDGKTLIGGYFSSYSGVSSNNIIRLNTDGTYDETFVVGTGFNGPVHSIKIQSDGKIIAGGYFSIFSGISTNNIVRLNTDGTYDETFVIGGGFDSGLQTISLQSDGKIIAGGGFSEYSGISSSRIVRLNTDGSYDSSFDIGNGFDGDVLTTEIQSDDKILVGGNFNSFNGNVSNRIARLNPDGSYDSSFDIGDGFDNTVYNITVDSGNDRIIVGGNYFQYNKKISRRIISLNTNGSTDICPLPPFSGGTRLEWTDINSTPVSNPNDVNEWNTFFDLPTYGNPFTAVTVSNNFVYLFGGSNISLKDNLFQYNNNILSIYDDSSIRVIGNTSFNNCQLLTNVNLLVVEECSLEEGDAAPFINCGSLQSIILPLIQNVSYASFQYCYSLTELNLSSVIDLGSNPSTNYVFFGISGNTIQMTLPEGYQTQYDGLPDGDLISLACYNDVIINSEPFIPFTGYTGELTLVWNDLINVPVADPNNVNDWNDFFDHPSWSTPFSSVTTGATSVTLIGGENIVLKGETNYPFNNSNLIEIIDTGCVCFVDNYAINTNNVTTIDLPELRIAAEGVFGYNPLLTSVNLPSLITGGDYLFDNCSSLVEIDLPSLKNGGERIMRSCTSLTTVNLPLLESVYIPYYYFNTVSGLLFDGCTSLTGITLPSIIAIGENSFKNCTSLTEVSLPVCTNLGGTVGNNDVFLNITGNTIDLIVPESVLTSNGGVPDGDIIYLGLSNDLTVNSEPFVRPSGLYLEWDTVGNVPVPNPNNVNDWNTFFDLPIYGNPFTGVTVIDQTVYLTGGSNIRIKDNLFQSNNNILSIYDDSSIRVVGELSFYACPSLTNVDLLFSEYISGNAFYGCTNLTSVILPSVTKVEYSSFRNCTSLTEIDLSSVVNLGQSPSPDYVFFDILGNTIQMTLPEGYMTQYDGLPDGDLITLACYSDVIINSEPFIPFTGYTGDLTLVWNDLANVPVADPNNVNDWNDFFDHPSWSTPFSSVTTGSTSVTLIGGENIVFKSLPNYPFNSSNLIEIIDTGCVCFVDSYAINNCDILTTIDLPELRITSEGSFAYNYLLTSVDLPMLITSGGFLFEDCSSLIEIDLPSLKNCVESFFNRCSSLTTVNLPLLESVYSYGSDIPGGYLFDGCTSLTGITLPSVVAIGPSTFQDCTSLTEVSLPACTNLGGSIGSDLIFRGISGNTINLTVNESVLTSHGGQPDGDILSLAVFNDVILNSEPFIPFTGYTGDLTLVWDDLANVPVSDPNDVNEWNAFFDLPSWSTPFSAVTTGETFVTLIGGGNITFRTQLFNNNQNIIQILDEGCVCFVGINTSGFINSVINQCYALTGITFPNLTILGSSIRDTGNLSDLNLPSVISLSQYAITQMNIIDVSLPSVNSTVTQSLYYIAPQFIYIPNCQNLGYNNEFNRVFGENNYPTGLDITLTVPQSLMSNNYGLPDGDILVLQSNNNVTVVEIPGPTPTPTVTPTNTPTPSTTSIPQTTPTNTNTPSVTPTNTNTPSQTGTPPVTPTNTPSNTPTPSQFIFEVNQQYQYTIEMLGAFDGQPLTGGTVPYPSIMGADGVEYIQLNAVQIGGFNGLNN